MGNYFFYGTLRSISVLENVTIYLDEHNIYDKETRISKALKILTELGIEEAANKMISELSGGMQKRVSFARALINDPRNDPASMPLLLFDEPTAGLDPVASTRIEDLIVKTTTLAKGCSIVVSHVLSTIERASERVVMIYGGKFQWDGSIEDFKKTKNPFIKQFRTGSLEGPMKPKEI